MLRVVWCVVSAACASLVGRRASHERDADVAPVSAGTGRGALGSLWIVAACVAVLSCGKSTRLEDRREETPTDDMQPQCEMCADELAACANASEPVLLAQGVNGEGALTLDDDDVYYVGTEGVSRVAKTGGEAATLGPADDVTLQIAVDADNVYWGGRSALWRRSKSGGEPRIELSGIDVVGNVARDRYLYFTDWSVVPSSLHRWSRDGGHETLVQHPGQLWTPVLHADHEYVYQMPAQTQGWMDLHRVRTSDGRADVLAQAQLVFGMTLDAGSAYLSAERMVLRVRLEDGRSETLFDFVDGDDYPTALAADERSVYLSLQRLIGSVYHGRLIRFRNDGSELCTLTAPVAYARGLAVDDSFVYYVRDGGLWRIVK